MSIFADILDVHTQALTRKGYDQQGLGLLGTQEDLLNKLEDAFGEVVRKNVWTRKPVPFPVEIVGRFEEHIAHFQFNYLYDPKRPRLDLHVLRAKIGDRAEAWIINNNNPIKDLPASKEVVGQLKTPIIAPQPSLPDDQDPPQQRIPRTHRH